jgi:hypothetical protein
MCVDWRIESTLYDVKFWPWPEKHDEEVVFAFTGGKTVCSML